MNKIRYLWLIAIIMLIIPFVGCKKNNSIDVPKNINIDEENKLSWDSIDLAKSYEISIYSVNDDSTDIEVTKKNYYGLDHLKEGDYEISIKAISGDKKLTDSRYCDKILFNKGYETGCIYKLINNETEYEINKVGKATGTFVIEDIYRGKAVTQIAEKAFRGSTKIVDVTVGNNVITIGDNAFYNCRELINVTIPTSVVKLGENCFGSCKKLEKIDIPYSIEEIPNSAFTYCRSLKVVTIEEGVKKINNMAFSECSSLTNIVLPDSLVSIGESAFTGCTGLTKIEIPKNVEFIGTFGFQRCSSLNDLKFNIDGNLKEINGYAFNDCSNLESIILPSKLEKIGAYSFGDCTKLENIQIPQSCKFVGTKCFINTKLYNTQLENNNLFIYADKWLVGYNKSLIESLKNIKPELFKEDCYGIAANTFYNNSITETLEVPTSIKYICEYSFALNEKLWKIICPANSVISFGDYAFVKCNLTNVTLGEGLEEIGNRCFLYNELLDNNSYSAKSMIPESVKRIGYGAFDGTKMVTNADAKDGIVYAGNWVVGYTKSVKNVNLDLDKERVAGIADFAFYNCDSLESIQGLSDCRYIGIGAFRECVKLSVVSLNRNLTEIREGTFLGCKDLVKVTMPRTLKSIDKYAFYQCDMLSEVDLSSTNCEHIGRSAFYEDRNITTIKFSKALKTIDEYAFYKCNAVEEIDFSENIETIGIKSFGNCDSLVNVNFNNKLKEIGEYAFSECTKLESIDIPNSVVEIKDNAFYKCTECKSLKLGNGIKTIGNYAFFDLPNVEELYLPESVKKIGIFAFKGMSALKSINISKNIEIIGQHAFYGCDNLTIYTDAVINNKEWHNRFNSSYRAIFYGCEFDENGFVKTINFNNENVLNLNCKNGLNGPFMIDHEFDHLSDDDKTYNMEDLKALKEGKILNVIYK